MTKQSAPPEALRYRDAAERRGSLLDLVNKAGFCTVADLSEELGVSRMTVRRDIQQLESDEKVRSAHGGVAALMPRVGGTELRPRDLEQGAARRAIAARTLPLLPTDSGATIGVDAGTSAFELTRLLYPRTPLRVVTHSLLAMTELAGRPNVELVGLGGVLNAATQAFAGPGTIEALSHFRLEALLLSADSVRDGAMYCESAFDAETRRNLIKIADRIIVLAHASVFERIAPFEVGPLSAADVVVVDSGIGAAGLASLEEAEVETIIAPLPPNA